MAQGNQSQSHCVFLNSKNGNEQYFLCVEKRTVGSELRSHSPSRMGGSRRACRNQKPKMKTFAVNISPLQKILKNLAQQEEAAF